MKIFSSKPHLLTQAIVLSLVSGFTAGMAGQIVADAYFDPISEGYLNQNVNTNINGGVTNAIPELQRVKRFLGIQQDFEVNMALERSEPSLVGIYKTKQAEGINQAYLPAELLGNGVVLTSDGWLVTVSSALGGQAFSSLSVIHQGVLYPVEELVADPSSDAVFLKISATNLPVAVLGDSEEVVKGQIVVTQNSLGHAAVSHVLESDYAPIVKADDLIRDTEHYTVKMAIVGLNQSAVSVGSPLLNLAGEIIGVVSANTASTDMATVTPINHFRPRILDVLRNKIIARPRAGISYIDLSSALGLDADVAGGYTRGSLVQRTPTATSPAGVAGLKLNDIILSVDAKPVDDDSSLTELIQQYNPGDEIKLEVARDGRIIDVDLTLDVVTQ